MPSATRGRRSRAAAGASSGGSSARRQRRLRERVGRRRGGRRRRRRGGDGRRGRRRVGVGVGWPPGPVPGAGVPAHVVFGLAPGLKVTGTTVSAATLQLFFSLRLLDLLLGVGAGDRAVGAGRDRGRNGELQRRLGALACGLSALTFGLASARSSPLRLSSLDSTIAVCDAFAFFLPAFVTASWSVNCLPGAGAPAGLSVPTLRSGPFLAASAGLREDRERGQRRHPCV